MKLLSSCLDAANSTNYSVDGLVGLDEVYTRDKDGKFDGLRDLLHLPMSYHRARTVRSQFARFVHGDIILNIAVPCHANTIPLSIGFELNPFYNSGAAP